MVLVSVCEVFYCVVIQVECSPERTGEVGAGVNIIIPSPLAPLLSFPRLQDKVSGDVKENGSHTVTSVTPPTQTPPTSTPPLIAPPPHTSAPSPFPPLHHTETIAPPTPSQLPGNNQTDSSDDVSLTDSNNKTNEGVAPEISHERDFEVHSSIGETTTTTEVYTVHIIHLCKKGEGVWGYSLCRDGADMPRLPYTGTARHLTSFLMILHTCYTFM